MPLSFAELNKMYIIKRVNGKDETRRHLANLGFVEGAEIKVVQSVGGNLIVEIKDVRVAIDESLTKRILI